jgi:hypothetical protein
MFNAEETSAPETKPRITLIVSQAFPVADSSQTSVSWGTTAVAENQVEIPRTRATVS